MSNYTWMFKNDNAYLTSPYGSRDGSFHNGIDLVVPTETNPQIYAIHAGTCVISQMNATAGGWVVIKEDDTHFDQYMHMVEGSIKVKVGDTVKGGDAIGIMGTTGNSTGVHLHLGITKILDAQSTEGTGYNPADLLDIPNTIGKVSRPASVNSVGSNDNSNNNDTTTSSDTIALTFMNIIPRWQ